MAASQGGGEAEGVAAAIRKAGSPRVPGEREIGWGHWKPHPSMEIDR